MNLIGALVQKTLPFIEFKQKIWGPPRPHWNSRLETVVSILRFGAHVSIFFPLKLQRWITDPPRPQTDIVRETKITQSMLGSVRAFFFERPESDLKKIILYLHGGGYSVCSVNSHKDIIARVCKESGCRVVGIDYRLAPEHPFPAQLQDALSAYRALLSLGYAPSSIALAGDSAGGALCVSMLVALRDADEPLPSAAALISPWVDLESRGDSFRENASIDFVQRKAMQIYAKRFTEKAQWKHPLVSPVYADLRDLPPILIHVGEAETLRDDSVMLARQIRDMGGHVELKVWPDMIHAFHVFAIFLPCAQKAIVELSEFLKENMRLLA